jgi:hypothetical protein
MRPSLRFLHSLRLLRILSLLLSAFSTALVAQLPVAPRLQTGFNAIRESDLRSNLTFIAGDGLEGRMSLQPGDDAAAEWVVSEFAKAGLQPAATDASGKLSFLQAVPLVEYKPDSSATSLSLSRKDGAQQQWHAPTVSSAFRENVDASGGLVYVGYGITAPELNYDDYANVDVRGKIVLLMEHEPQEDDPKSIFNGTGNTRYATSRVKLLNAQRHGAIAVLLMPEPNATHVPTSKRLANVLAGVTAKRLTPIPLQAIANDEVGIALMTIQPVVADELLQSSGATAKELQSSIDRDLKSHSREIAGVQLHLQTKNSSSRTAATYNAVGLLPGSDPALAAETLIVSGHHDHNGASEVEQDGRRHLDIWHGADDNGSGTVGVVELAHAFAANPIKPKRSILFVVFASEERGLLGSYYMAQHPLRPLAATRAMVNFDMIGRDEKPSTQTDGVIEIPADTTNRLNLVGTLYSPDFLHTVQHEDEHIGLTLDDRFERDTALGIFFRSDQFPFILHDVPALWFFTGFHPDYHHVTDTVDKIDFTKMTKIVRLSYLTLFAIADERQTPKFVANPALGK